MLTCCRVLEFRVFVEAAERQLLLLFRSIDHNGDGKVGKEELRMAFKSAGLAVPGSRLEEFFNDIDMNNDGYISFDEWRYVYHPRSIAVYVFCLPSLGSLQSVLVTCCPPKTWRSW